jgi:hypothetical protein
VESLVPPEEPVEDEQVELDSATREYDVESEDKGFFENLKDKYKEHVKERDEKWDSEYAYSEDNNFRIVSLVTLECKRVPEDLSSERLSECYDIAYEKYVDSTTKSTGDMVQAILNENDIFMIELVESTYELETKEDRQWELDNFGFPNDPLPDDLPMKNGYFKDARESVKAWYAVYTFDQAMKARITVN